MEFPRYKNILLNIYECIPRGYIRMAIIVFVRVLIRYVRFNRVGLILSIINLNCCSYIPLGGVLLMVIYRMMKYNYW